MFLLSEIVIPEKCNRMYNNKTSKVKRVSMTRKCHNHISQINLRHTKEEIPEYPQDNFSWALNCSLGPPGCETKVSSKKFWFGLCDIAWFLWQPAANLRRGGGVPTKLLISQLLLI